MSIALVQCIAQQEQWSPVSAANTPQAMHTVNSYCEVHCIYKGIAVIWRSKIENLRCTQMREEGPLGYSSWFGEKVKDTSDFPKMP